MNCFDGYAHIYHLISMCM